MKNKKDNRDKFIVAMEAYKELEGSGLLSSTDSVVILSRIRLKYRLSPVKYLRQGV